MENLFIVVVTVFVAYGLYHVWYVSRGTSKKDEGAGSRPVDSVKQGKK
jgi:hypothetical protein